MNPQAAKPRNRRNRTLARNRSLRWFVKQWIEAIGLNHSLELENRVDTETGLNELRADHA